MKPNTSQLHARGFIVLAFSALLLTSASAEPNEPDIAKRPPANIKIDVGSAGVKGSKSTLAPRKIEDANARSKAGGAGYWELGEDGAKAPRAKNAKALSGGEAGTRKGAAKWELSELDAARTPRAKATSAASGNSGSFATRKANAQYNPKELSVDKRK